MSFRPKSSGQGESNPHDYHGKVAGYRYIMAAFAFHQPVGPQGLEP